MSTVMWEEEEGRKGGGSVVKSLSNDKDSLCVEGKQCKTGMSCK